MPSDFITFPITHSDLTHCYVGVIWRNGRGRVFEDPDTDELISPQDMAPVDDTSFTHNRADFDELLVMPVRDRDGLLTEWFIEEINNELSDPFAFNLDFQGDDVYFFDGSYEALKRLVQLIVLTEPGVDPDSSDCIVIESGDSDERGNRLAEDGYWSERIEQLVEYAIEENSFSGSGGYSYNDGADDQLSGYSCSDLTVSFEIAEIFRGASARDRMKAPAELRTWLESKGHDAHDFLPELEKVA